MLLRRRTFLEAFVTSVLVASRPAGARVPAEDPQSPHGPVPFRIRVPDADLADLRERLARTRWADSPPRPGWDYGADPDVMRALAARWQRGFDWRAREARLNRFPQFVVEVDDQKIHFVHVRGKGPSPRPLIITHGWPSSFAEFEAIIPLLTDPGAHGGDPADAFDVVAPSLPGFGFSSSPAKPGLASAAVADLWAALMADRLGYGRFFAHGGDIGAGVTTRLGRRHPDKTIAIHTMAVPPLYGRETPDLTEAERAWLDVIDRWEREEGAYEHLQRTRPQTLAYGLEDSPVGLAAWIVEKWRNWSDCGGDVLSKFSADDLLTTVSIYWFTRTIAPSIRMYWESAHLKEAGLLEKVRVPARVFLTREEVNLCPESYAARVYADLSYGLAPRGGHFMAGEEPELLAADLRSYFRRFR